MKEVRIMKNLKRTRYYTMNSWNRSKSLAYNLKIYNVINRELQDACYNLLDVDYFYEDYINPLIEDFEYKYNFEWQAGFNGRSGGYLVLYKGGRHENGRVYCSCGLNITEDEVPTEVKKDFRRLAIDIVKTAEYMAKNFKVEEEEISVPKTVKVLKEV
jgi:hypothetical protein